MASTTTIHEFQSLGNNIYLWEPPDSSANNKDSVQSGRVAPSLVILCTWLGGSTTNRVDKYTTGYRTLFPASSILLLRTVFVDLSARTFGQIRAPLAPARGVIRRLTAARRRRLEGEGPDPDGAILLHMFSHGGCNTALQLAASMQQERLHFPLSRIIFDCCPGDATYRKAYDAAALSLPGGQPANGIGKILLHIPIAAITGAQSLGLMRSVRDLRIQLNDPQTFGSEALRMYLYSRADRMVDFTDIQSHMQDARNMGYAAEGILFETSAHCALPMEDAARYWQAIETFWKASDLSEFKQAPNIDDAVTAETSKL